MSEKYWNYAIGDIHGCYDELIALEKKIKIHARKKGIEPFIISVGDLIDRGNKSAEVVEHFRQGTIKGTHIALMGNHELLMIEALEAFAPQNFARDDCNYPDWFYNYKINYEERRGMSRFLSWEDYKVMTKSMWLGQGGFSTLKSYNCDPHETDTWNLPKESVNYLVNLPFYFEKENFIATHALPFPDDLDLSVKIINGSANNLIDSSDAHILRNAVHSMVWNRTIPEERIHKNKIHISGHTPLFRIKRNKTAASIQIDTACVFGGKLTALCVESNTFISVKANRNYIE